MFVNKILEDLQKIIPENLRHDIGTLHGDIKKAAKVAAGSAMQKLDLVSREEYDIQVAVLARTRAKLEALEAQLAAQQAAQKTANLPATCEQE